MLKIIAATLVLLCGSAAQAQTLQGRDLNSDGTFDAYYDTVQNISWLADANYYASLGNPVGTTYYGSPMEPGQLSFVQAVSWVAGLSVQGVGDWRLPDRLVPSGGSDPLCSPTSCYAGTLWPTEMSLMLDGLGGAPLPFGNVQVGSYMSNVNGGYVELQGLATNTRQLTDETSLVFGYVLPVRNGDIGQFASVSPVPEPSTYALMAVGLVGLGFASRRRLRNGAPSSGLNAA